MSMIIRIPIPIPIHIPINILTRIYKTYFFFDLYLDAS
jgi:hypothetical protein